MSASPECLMNRGEPHRLRTGSPAHYSRPSGSGSYLPPLLRPFLRSASRSLTPPYPDCSAPCPLSLRLFLIPLMARSPRSAFCWRSFLAQRTARICACESRACLESLRHRRLCRARLRERLLLVVVNLSDASPSSGMDARLSPWCIIPCSRALGICRLGARRSVCALRSACLSRHCRFARPAPRSGPGL